MAVFLEQRSKAEALFEDCINFSEQNGFREASLKMKEIKEDLKRKLCILTCGEARRGKSSLLGALLEDAGLFPVDIAVTTCLVTMVSYGEQEKINIIMDDNSMKEISRGEIEEYVTEKKNTNNEKKAKMLLIETPNPKLKEGLTFVDTPGVGSLNPEHSIATIECLPQADVVLFVSDSQKPLTETETAFLKQVKKYSSNILFLLTKKDLCSDASEYEKIMEDNKEKIHQATGLDRNKIPYVPISSALRLSAAGQKNPALAKRQLRSSNFQEFETKLWDMLAKNRSRILFIPPLKELAKEFQTVDKELGIRLVGLGDNTQIQTKLSQELSSLTAKQQELSSADADWRKKIRKKISAVNMEINSKIASYQINVTNLLDQELANTSNKKTPELILNQVVTFTAMQATDMRDYIENELRGMYTDFDREMDMNISETLISPEVTVEQNPDIVFKKMSTMDQAVYVGRAGAGEGYGLRTVGSLAGGVLGGIAGFLAAGPAGAVAGFTFGSMAGSSLGGTVGTLRGTYKVIREGGINNTPQIRAEIMKYISQTVTEWKTSLPKYMTETSYTLEDNLDTAIKNRMARFRDNRKALEDSAKLSVQERQSEQKKLAEIRKAGMKLIQQIGKLANQMIRPEDAESDFYGLDD